MNQQPATNNRQPSLKPILFSTPMVQSILNGTKTQTRRVLKEQPRNGMEHLTTCATSIGMLTVFQDDFLRYLPDAAEEQYQQRFKCPYGKPGDILWVRESYTDNGLGYFRYKADWIHLKEGVKGNGTFTGISVPEKFRGKWKPSIHMPYTACRLFLKIKSIRVERLKAITAEDAKAEGIEWKKYPDGQEGWHLYDMPTEALTNDPVMSFCSLWKSINGNESWYTNPWVWVIDFQPTQKPTA